MGEATKINWPPDYHRDRWRWCLSSFVTELLWLDGAKDIVDKYQARLYFEETEEIVTSDSPLCDGMNKLEDVPRLSLEFPEDYDQSKLPDRLQKEKKDA